MMKSAPMVASVVSTADCAECLGQPPPHFGLPPPPRPPYLHDLADCSQAQFLDLKTCSAIPVIDAEYHSSPALPSLGLIIVCSILLLGIFLTVIALLWKHKKKIQHFSPCKSSPQNRCDVPHSNNVIYEDLTNICPRPLPQQPVSNDLKYSSGEVPYHLSLFACAPRPTVNGFTSQDPYNPIYEELSYGSRERESESEAQVPLSDDDFAEDELSIGDRDRCIENSNASSLQRSSSNDLCHENDAIDRNRYISRMKREYPVSTEQPKKNYKKRDSRPSSIDRHHGRNHKQPPFTEDILLDAFFHYQPEHARAPYTLPVSSGHCDMSYPARQEFTTFRPSHDSDSGYSHNTFGGRASSRGRNDYHLPYSLDFILS